jgi:hypothetical protein
MGEARQAARIAIALTSEGSYSIRTLRLVGFTLTELTPLIFLTDSITSVGDDSPNVVIRVPDDLMLEDFNDAVIIVNEVSMGAYILYYKFERGLLEV